MRSTTRLSVAAVTAALLTTSVVGSALAQDASGNVVISGSSTVEPISLAVAEEFNLQNGNWTYSVEGPGTTAGFEQFCNGDTDISNASRAIKDSEVETCAANGIEPIELYVAIDGLAVITNPADEALQCLDFADLYAIFGPESDEIRTWEDAAALATELGSGTTSWPTGDLAITAPGDESGTHDSFIEITLQDLAEERGIEDAMRTPGAIYVASPNDNVIIDGVSGFPTGIGFVGYAFAVNNPDRVRMVGIDGGDGNCVVPSEETVADGSYPIARPLFIYPDNVRIDPASDRYNKGIEPYVDFYLSDEGQELVSVVGYVRIPEDALAETRAAWEAAKSAVAGS